MSAPMARWTNTTTWEDLLVSDQRKAKIPLHRQSTSVARQLQRPARTIVSQQHTLGDMSSLSIGKESSSLVPEAHGVVLKPRHSLTEERRRQSALMKQRTMGSIHDTSLPSRLLARISKDLSLGNGALHRSDTLEKGPEVKRSAPSYLDPEHLRTLLGEVEPDMASMTSDVASVVKFLFDAADTNKDGYISYSDMRYCRAPPVCCWWIQHGWPEKKFSCSILEAVDGTKPGQEFRCLFCRHSCCASKKVNASRFFLGFCVFENRLPGSNP